MNSTPPDDLPSRFSSHLPLAFLGVAAAIFLFAQISSAQRVSETARWQLGSMDEQLTALQENEKKLDELIASRNDQVTLAEKVQKEYSTLLEEVLALAENDADARKFVEKWQLRRNAATPAESTPPGL